jgi:hypothetical protein
MPVVLPVTTSQHIVTLMNGDERTCVLVNLEAKLRKLLRRLHLFIKRWLVGYCSGTEYHLPPGCP